MDKEIMDQFQMLAGIMESMSEKLDTNTNRLSADITQLNIRIEHDVTKRIDGLFDGYKLAHEKQYELEREFARKTTEMQLQIDNLQARLAALESRIA